MLTTRTLHAGDIVECTAIALTEQGEDGAGMHASSPGSSYHFGQTVAISGDVAVVGVPDDDDLDTRAVSVYVSRYNGLTWVDEAKLNASDAAALARVGAAIAVTLTVQVAASPSGKCSVPTAGTTSPSTGAAPAFACGARWPPGLA